VKIWKLSDPGDDRYANASRRGAWSPSVGLCTECGASRQRRVKPLIIEWEPGSDRIGDVTCVGFNSDAAVTDRAVKALDKCGGFEPSPVEMYQNPKLKRPRTSLRTKPRVWLPYEGRPMFELWITLHVYLDPKKSSIRLLKVCETCGLRRYEALGIERWETTWDKDRLEGASIHFPRKPGCGIYVNESDLAGSGLFRVHEFPAWIFCTDSVKKIVESEGLTNVSFREMGDTI
jgi:hypothetical protein